MQATYLYSRMQIHIRMGQVPNPNKNRKRDEKVRTRNIKINVFLNEDEKRIFDEKAKKSGLNKSEFFRKIILDYKLKEQPDERFYEILSQLRGMANNLNQMARTYNRYQGYMREDKFTPLLHQIRDLVLSLEQVYLLPQKKGTLYGNNKTMEI